MTAPGQFKFSVIHVSLWLCIDQFETRYGLLPVVQDLHSALSQARIQIETKTTAFQEEGPDGQGPHLGPRSGLVQGRPAHVEPAKERGQFATYPMLLEGARIVLNAQTLGEGSTRVELQDVEGNVFPGYESPRKAKALGLSSGALLGLRGPDEAVGV